MTKKEIIEILLSKYLKNELDEKETRYVESWIMDNEENKQEFERIRRILAEQNIHFSDQEIQKAREKIKTAMLSRLLSNRRKYKQLTGVFSVLIIFTSSLAFYFSSQPHLNTGFEYGHKFIVKTGDRECSECVLPDSTHIWLNSNSEISYQLKEDGMLRCVEIKGEAFFDVVKMKKVPFEVWSGDIRVKVFGTKFNFKVDNFDIQVTLEEGSLGIYDQSQNEIVKLVPGVQATVNRYGTLLSLNNVDTEAFSGWKTGNVEFKDVSLEVISNQLSSIYGVEIKFQNELIKKERFRCTINRKRSVLQTLELLKQTSDLNYTIKGSEIIFLSK